MRRMFGMMPSSEVSIQKAYKDQFGFQITVQAGTKGWTVLYADSSSSYQNEEDTAENNFEKALKFAASKLGELTEVKRGFDVKAD